MCVCRAVKSGYIATFLFFKDENNFKRHSYNSNPPPPTVHMNSDLLLWTKKKKNNWALECKCWFPFFLLLLLFLLLFIGIPFRFPHKNLWGKQRDVHNPS